MRIRTLLSIALGSAVMVMLPTNAYAGGQNGVIEAGELVFYHKLATGGSYTDFRNGKANLGCCTFIAAGSGQGSSVKNNARSIENWNTVRARVFFNSDYAGIYDTIPAGVAMNLSNTYDENASFKWLGS